MALNYLEVLSGTFSIIYVSISVAIGLIMISKYFKVRERLLIYVGITWIGIVSPWMPSSISFIIALFNNVGLSAELYFIIGNAAAPAIIIIWMFAFTKFLYKEKQKLILVISLVYAITFEVLFFTFLTINPLWIGEYDPPVDVDYLFPFIILVASVIVIIFVTGILFARESLRAPSPELRLKGKFLFAAFISYTVGAVLDAVIPLSQISVFIIPITRIILISASIEWYLGFILPKRVKELLLK